MDQSMLSIVGGQGVHEAKRHELVTMPQGGPSFHAWQMHLGSKYGLMSLVRMQADLIRVLSNHSADTDFLMMLW